MITGFYMITASVVKELKLRNTSVSIAFIKKALFVDVIPKFAI